MDLAPTLLDLAGVAIGSSIQGRSLVPLFSATPSNWREAVLVEFYTNEQPFSHLLDVDYRVVRTARYEYIHWVKYPEQDELYDLRTDSLERHNVARDPAMARVRATMQAALGRMVVEALGLKTP